MTKRRQRHSLWRNKNRPPLFLGESKSQETVPVEPVFNIGACEGCPSYRSEMPHELDSEGKGRIYCTQVGKMVTVQIGLDTHHQCNVFQTDTADVQEDSVSSVHMAVAIR